MSTDSVSDETSDDTLSSEDLAFLELLKKEVEEASKGDDSKETMYKNTKTLSPTNIHILSDTKTLSPSKGYQGNLQGEYQEQDMTTIDLSLAIEALGLGKECIGIYKHLDFHFDIIRDTFFRKSMKNAEAVGSYFEGLFGGVYQDIQRYSSPDIDFVFNYIADDILTIISCPNFPGYVYLKQNLVLEFLPNNIFQLIRYTNVLLQENIGEITHHGPALTRYLDFFGNSRLSKTDCVYVFTYTSWPEEACKWVNRNKPRNWPPKELIEEIKSKGFNLAPVGHYDCDSKEFQWRIGIKGEKVLLSNLNETQMLCYISLKLILRCDIQRIHEDALSSYHMKNVIFWCSEQESCQWKKENFEICLKTCINRLIKFIECGHFPHYFIEDRNLINSKMTIEVKARILEALTKYSRDISAILSLSSFEFLKELTSLNVESLESSKQMSIIQACIMFYFGHPFGIFFSVPNKLWETYEGHNTVINLKTAQTTLSILEDRKRHFIRHHIAYAKNMLGLLYYSRYMETHCQIDKWKAEELLRSSLTFANVSLKFRVATFYFMENALDDCLDVCNAFLSNPSQYKSLDEQIEHSKSIFTKFLLLIIRSIDPTDPRNLIKLKQKILEIFYEEKIYDRVTSEKCGDGGLQQAQKYLSSLTEERFVSLGSIQHDTVLLVFENYANLVFCDMSLNVPYLASEKWAVPEVIQYELMSVFSCDPESYVYGIYIDPMLNCLVLTFLCYQNRKNWKQRDEMMKRMFNYINEYSKLVHGKGRIPAEHTHSLPLYRVYNIVAYCCIKAGHYQMASNYIRKSFNLDGSVKNAANGYIRCVCGILNSLFITCN